MTTPMRTRQLTLPRDAQAPAEARHALRDYLDRLGYSLQEAAELQLAMGEAVTNAVVHGGAGSGESAAPDEISITFGIDDGSLVVAVTSPRTGWTVPGHFVTPGLVAMGGWGLYMIQQMTDAMAIEQTSGGTTVSFKRRLPGKLRAFGAAIAQHWHRGTTPPGRSPA